MNSRRGFFKKLTGGAVAAIILTSKKAVAVDLPKEAFIRFVPEARAWLRGPNGLQFEAKSIKYLRNSREVQFFFGPISPPATLSNVRYFIDELAVEFLSSPTSVEIFRADRVPGLPFTPNGGEVTVSLEVRF